MLILYKYPLLENPLYLGRLVYGMQTYKQINLIAAVAIAMGSMMIQGATAVFASHLKIHQSISQAKACDSGASCDNTAQNDAKVSVPPHSSNHVKISQHVD